MKIDGRDMTEFGRHAQRCPERALGLRRILRRQFFPCRCCDGPEHLRRPPGRAATSERGAACALRRRARSSVRADRAAADRRRILAPLDSRRARRTARSRFTPRNFGQRQQVDGPWRQGSGRICRATARICGRDEIGEARRDNLCRRADVHEASRIARFLHARLA